VSSGADDIPIVIARLNDRAQPLDRGELYEDPLDAVLREAGLGRVTGGGTQLDENGEVEYCEVEIELAELSERALQVVPGLLERLGAPKGSRLIVPALEQEIPFGSTEGLAIYLNGTDLPDEVYRESDVNHVYTELGRLLGDGGRIHSHWEGPAETALYLYGESFDVMKGAIADFVDTYPLCQRARIVRVA
jgi:hypothetical protein